MSPGERDVPAKLQSSYRYRFTLPAIHHPRRGCGRSQNWKPPMRGRQLDRKGPPIGRHASWGCGSAPIPFSLDLQKNPIHRSQRKDRRDAIHINALGSPFDGKGTGQLIHRSFAGRIGQIPYPALKSSHRRDVDDLSLPLFQHHPADMFATKKDRFQVDIDHSLPGSVSNSIEGCK